MTSPSPASISRTPLSGGGRVAPATVFYMLLPGLLLGASVLGHVVMVSLATNDPGFSLVPDYYRKASNFEAELEQRRASEQLGYRIGVVHFGRSKAVGESELVVLVTDRVGRPVTKAEISVGAFPVARADRVHDVRLVAAAERPGEYRGRIPGPRAGLWELAFDARTPEGRFTSVLRADLASGERVP